MKKSSKLVKIKRSRHGIRGVLVFDASYKRLESAVMLPSVETRAAVFRCPFQVGRSLTNYGVHAELSSVGWVFSDAKYSRQLNCRLTQKAKLKTRPFEQT